LIFFYFKKNCRVCDLQSSQAGKQIEIKIYQNLEKNRKTHAIEHWRWAILWQYKKKS
jgi:hypothetical protein